MKSFRYALAGIFHAIKTERNLRFHLCMTAYVLFFAWYGEVPYGRVPILFVCIGAVLTAELVNTAIETLCDLIHPELHPAIKITKDVSAGAVLVSAIAAAAAGLWIFLDSEVLATVWDKFRETPSVPIVLAVCAIASLFLCNTKKS